MFWKKQHMLLLSAVCVLTAALLPCARAQSVPAFANATVAPGVQLRHWQASSESEQLAFLFGIVSMLELEKDWQRASPEPVSKSLVSSWSLGLEGLTLRQMREGVNRYIDLHPDQSDRQVLEVLWFVFVQPKLTPAMRREAVEAYGKRVLPVP